MNSSSGIAVAGVEQAGVRTRLAISRATAVVVVGVLFATQLLISPDPQARYPGEAPWSSFSLLHRLIQLMSLGGLVASARGVEIKDLVLHVGSAALLMLMAARAAAAARFPGPRRGEWGAWMVGQLLLLGWATVSLTSAAWSVEPDIAAAQATIYVLYAGLAVGLAWTLEPRDLALIVWGVIGSAAVASILCIWYFCERNWQHRPGFPTGNPGVLSATLLPGIIAAACILRDRFTGRTAARPQARGPTVFVAVALAVMLACLALTGARSALLALAAGVVGLLVFTVPPRLRWGLAGAGVTLLVVAGVYFYSTRLDTLMARGATIRFRTYMWRYASEIWMQRPVSGAGAGAFSYLSGGLGVRDRALDPAAFMGDWAGHAHNELFEVLAEIGLLGGVTFVGAWVACVVAALEILRSPLSAERRAMVLGLLGGVLALLADMMFSVSLRLPGVPAYLFVATGAIWALGRASATETEPPHSAGGRRRVALRVCVTGAAALTSLGAMVVTVRDWEGVRAEFAAQQALRRGDASTAVAQSQRAACLLLDPIRRLYAEEWAVRARLALAEAAFAECQALETAAEPASAPAGSGAAARAERLATDAYEAALALDRRAPTLMSMPATAARCAEMLTTMLSRGDPRTALSWYERADAAWRLQRRQSPFDVDALLALESRYAALEAAETLEVRVELLRDALRGGLADARWQRAFERCAAEAGFPAVLNGLLAQANPIDPRTGIDALVISLAPEAFRLAAAYHATRGEYAEAARFAARAAELYAPLKARFPELRAAGLLEQAEYEFRGAARGCGAAVELAERAIAELPRIQRQHYDALAAPYRARRLLYMLAAGREADVRTALAESGAVQAALSAELAQHYVTLCELLVRNQPARRGEVLTWLEAAIRLNPHDVRAWAWKCWDAAERRDVAAVRARLRQAEEAGTPSEGVEQIRRSLAQEFPELAASWAP
ncbi:MAG: hypothetical protein CHACPFDD_02785 [Phycisphaerae bacterium]|nr:hypothetical protein [Phycisphaerae bacterium]